ncbi:MAG TPA: DUF397 domain-containing protein [Trebonia sp.]|nr:DUF397 domain-containing protein [Trebonia sp.]
MSPGWRKSSYSNGGATNCVEVGAVPWRKSSYSNGNGGQCVEVGALPWRKSTYSNSNGGQCLEAAHAPGTVLVRDTKDHGAGPVLRVTPGDWARFTATVRAPAPLG